MSSGEPSPSIPSSPAIPPTAHRHLEEDVFDPGLSQLKDQVNKVMVPLLVKTFELKLAAEQAEAPPCRLEKHRGVPPEKIRKQLEKLGDHVKQLQLWCNSCQNQISKALDEMEEKQKTFTSASDTSKTGPFSTMETSFSNLIALNASSLKTKKTDSKQAPPKKIKDENSANFGLKSKLGILAKWLFRSQKT